MDNRLQLLLEKYADKFEPGWPASFDVDSGWYDILKELFDNLEPFLNWDIVKICQVKEKFGGLRVYVDFHGDIDAEDVKQIHDMIDDAESKSLHTCESCGAIGEVRTIGWIKTLCDDCHNDRENSKVKI